MLHWFADLNIIPLLINSSRIEVMSSQTKVVGLFLIILIYNQQNKRFEIKIIWGSPNVT